MQIQIDIEGMLASAMQQALSQETLKPILDKALNETLERAIKEAFGYNSDFRKLMETAVADAMPKRIDGLVIMGELITNRIKEVVGAQQQEALAQIIDAQLQEITGKVPEKMKLSEMCRELTSRWDSCSYDRPNGSRPTIIKKTSSYGSVSLYLDKDEGKDEHDASFELHISADAGNILSLRIRGEELGPKGKYLSRRYNDELYLTQLFAAGTKFEIDMGNGEYHDHYYRDED